MPRGIRLAFTECSDPSREEEFNRWYTHTHLPDLSRAHGFVRSRRFVSTQPGTPSKYLAVYEFESESLERSFAAQKALVEEAHNTGRHIDCLKAIGVYPYREIEPAEFKPLERIAYKLGR